ncbi:hypothetical protein FB451DRAFT_1454434 [Mycena latifolia]|nr:hypothetical protein FB451DRAFT_1454434 [Mycena latifolia]
MEASENRSPATEAQLAPREVVGVGHVDSTKIEGAEAPSRRGPLRCALPALPTPAVFDDAPIASRASLLRPRPPSACSSLNPRCPSRPRAPACTPELAHDAPTRTPLPTLLSPAVFDDTPIAPAPLSRPRPSSHPSRSPPRPPCALPGASSPSSAHGSIPRPAAAADSSPPVQSEGPVASPPPAPLNTPAVPGSTPINPGVGSQRRPGRRCPVRTADLHRAPDGVAQGKDAPLPLDAPHFRVVDSGAAPPVPPKTVAPDLAPPPALPTVASPPLPPAPTTAVHDEDSGSGSGSDAADAAAAGKPQRKKKPKLLQRLKDKMHVGMRTRAPVYNTGGE